MSEAVVDVSGTRFEGNNTDLSCSAPCAPTELVEYLNERARYTDFERVAWYLISHSQDAGSLRHSAETFQRLFLKATHLAEKYALLNESVDINERQLDAQLAAQFSDTLTSRHSSHNLYLAQIIGESNFSLHTTLEFLSTLVLCGQDAGPSGSSLVLAEHHARAIAPKALAELLAIADSAAPGQLQNMEAGLAATVKKLGYNPEELASNVKELVTVVDMAEWHLKTREVAKDVAEQQALLLAYINTRHPDCDATLEWGEALLHLQQYSPPETIFKSDAAVELTEDGSLTLQKIARYGAISGVSLTSSFLWSRYFHAPPTSIPSGGLKPVADAALNKDKLGDICNEVASSIMSLFHSNPLIQPEVKEALSKALHSFLLSLPSLTAFGSLGLLTSNWLHTCLARSQINDNLAVFEKIPKAGRELVSKEPYTIATMPIRNGMEVETLFKVTAGVALGLGLREFMLQNGANLSLGSLFFSYSGMRGVYVLLTSITYTQVLQEYTNDIALALKTRSATLECVTKKLFPSHGLTDSEVIEILPFPVPMPPRPDKELTLASGAISSGTVDQYLKSKERERFLSELRSAIRMKSMLEQVLDNKLEDGEHSVAEVAWLINKVARSTALNRLLDIVETRKLTDLEIAAILEEKAVA